MDYVLRFLTDYAGSLSYEKLPKEVVHHVKRRVIDSFGCAFGAYFMEPPKIARAQALESKAVPGATVFGTSHRTSPDLAAFANGVMVRYLDYNDTSMSVDGGHPSDNIPAVLAAAEYAGADAKAAITAIVLAYEVQDRLGDVCGVVKKKGWDHIVYVAISSAAGASKVMGLTGEQMANALALATTTSAALLQTRVGMLSMWKGCAAANSTHNGVFAALLARRGLTGPEEAFVGPRGFFKQLVGNNVELPKFGGNGQPFKVELAKFKYFPTDHEVQTAIHPALELRQALGGRVDEIERIVVDTYDLAVDIAADSRDKWNPTTRETADHSIPYGVAAALIRGGIWLDDFTEAKIRDPKVHALMQKIEVRRKDEYTQAHPEANWFRIEVTTRSGQQVVREVSYPKGHPKNPMSDQEIEAKFRKLAAPVLTTRRSNQVLDRLWHLEEVDNLQEVFALCKLSKAK